jgi:hypothetical protein
MKHLMIAAMIILSTWGTAYAQLNVPSDGSDGAFNPTQSITIDLSQAVTATWNIPSPQPGKGVYDADKWAVVFKFSSVNIPSNVTVTFINHPSNAPVVWLVQGNVTMSGAVNLNGTNGGGTPGTLAVPGPGGFRGGAAMGSFFSGSGGFGPGGGKYVSGTFNSGSYGTAGSGQSGPLYGNPGILPLIGGSGGAARTTAFAGGGAGGGAILIAANNNITVNGPILVQGGGLNVTGAGYGSGGAIRLICQTFGGNTNGLLSADSGSGSSNGRGRIRIESFDVTYTGSAVPAPVLALPDDPVLIWAPNTYPSVRVLEFGDQAVPSDPRSNLGQNADIRLPGPGTVRVRIETRNVPSNWRVYVRIVPRRGADFTIDAQRTSGNDQQAIYEVDVNMPVGVAAIQARAVAP